MQFNTIKEKLLQAIQTADKIVGKKESLPVLSCILIDVQKDVVIKATNLESSVEIKLSAEVKEKGQIALPSSIFVQTIRSITSDKVSISLEDGNVLLESRGSKTIIKSVPHTEFPSFPLIHKKDTVSLETQSILSGIKAVSYAASHSMIRPELGSIYIALKDKTAIFAATDSFRLAERTIQKQKNTSGTELLIPLKHAVELEHILERVAEDTISVVIEDAHLSVFGEQFVYMSRVIDATFPNYKDIIPKQFVTEATLLKSDFSETLKKARVFSGSEQSVGLHVYPKKKLFSATARSGDIGEMSDSIEAALTGEDLDINFHIEYLSDCLQSIQGESIHLGFAGMGKPLVIKAAGDESFLYLVMPLNR